MKLDREKNPILCWLVDHLADLWLFGFVTPVVFYLLVVGMLVVS